MAGRRRLIFLHIPKTAGNTLRTIIHSQYPRHAVLTGPGFRLREELRTLPEHRVREIRVLQGHMPFGLHEYVTGPVEYMTILRHPVDRVISTYYFILGRPEHPLYEEVVGNNMSLRDFVESGVAPEASNQQTRLISGLRGNTAAQDLEVAERNLESYFSAVGLAERFDASMVLFKRILGWSDFRYGRRNVTRNRPPNSDIPKSTINSIEQNNILDLELYQFAKQRFDEAVEEQGPAFWEEVDRTQRLNGISGVESLDKSRPDVTLPRRI